MIRIKPVIDVRQPCPRCARALAPDRVLWQGIHVCAVARCAGCGAEIVGDLPVGAAIDHPYQVDLKEGLLFGGAPARSWLGEPFLESLLHPDDDPALGLEIEVRERRSRVVILDCIDYLYGHALLKLLNAPRHFHQELGLVVLVPRFLRWMVPAGVAEVWVVDIALSGARTFRPRLDRLIQAECARYEEVYVSEAFSHPRDFDISAFTGAPKHDFAASSYRVTFIWREDRLWTRSTLANGIAGRSAAVRALLLARQNQKVQRLFTALRRAAPGATFTVAGLGRTTRFPAWIDDRRVARFDEAAERSSCQVFSESRLVVGVHGSSMLLPSGHAGLTLDLMPGDRWGNLGQDILYQEEDVRLGSFRYRFLPIGSSAIERCAIEQLTGFPAFRAQMLPGK